MLFGKGFNQFNKIIIRCTASVGLCLCALLFAVPFFAERLPVKSFMVADGLLRDNVTRIRQDSHGFLWFCTAEGISRFDGFAMTNFTADDGLPDRSAEDFLETKNGEIYIATGKGLARLNPNGIRGSNETPLFTVISPDNPKAEKIVTLFEGKNDQIWVGTSDGLYKLIETGGQNTLEHVPLGEFSASSGGAFTTPEPNSLYVKKILEDRHGTLWIGTYGSGLFRLSPNGNIRRFTNTDGIGDNKITDLLEDRKGQLWVSLRSDKFGGVCLLDTEATEHPVKKCYTEKDGLGSNWVRAMLETSDGQIWLATIPGLCRWQGEDSPTACKTYSAKNDLCDDLLALAEDKDGNLWTGSPCGAKKIARYGFTTYNAADGLYDDHVNSIFENSTGELFATAFPKNERVISRFDGDKFSFVKPNLPDNVAYHSWGWEQTVRQDSLGAWWIATGVGLFRSPDNTIFENLDRTTFEKIETGAKALEIFRLFEDSRGDVWIQTTGSTNELLRWERAKNTWHDYTAQVGFSNFRGGSAFVEDSFGNVWIAASSDRNNTALIRYRNGEFRVLTQPEGAPSGWIWDLFIDSRKRLWITSTMDGLWRLDDSNADSFEFTKYTPANGLTSIAAAAITEDEFGRIYVGTWRGIDRLNPDTGQIENFTTADGLPSSFVETAYRDRQNNLWFGTNKGLARFVPEPVRVRVPPNIFISGLKISGVPQSVSILGETDVPNIELNSDQRQITIDFLGLGTNLGERLKYEYRFGDSDWTQTAERTVNFANLASGAYQFEVRAQTADRIYSQSATVSFKIATPIWQRWWFIVGVLILIGLAFYWFYRFRLIKLLEIERTRTRIATDLHDDIGTNLSKIALLSEIVNMQLANGNEEHNRLLNTIAETSRESVAAMSDIVWTISPKSDSMLEMTRRMRQHAEEIFVEKNVRVKFNAPDDSKNTRLSMDMRREIYLIFKEVINNASKHSACSNVEIDFQANGNEFYLSVSDDGQGFDDAQKSDGNGLQNMRMRAEKMNADLEIESGKDRGTKIIIRMRSE